MSRFHRTWHKTPRPARRVIVFIVGAVCIIAGICMLVLPGPGWATIFLGLAIMATEFDRAEQIRATIAKKFREALDKAKHSGKR